MSQQIGTAGAGIRLLSRPVARRTKWESLEVLSTIGLGVIILVAALFYVWQHVHVVRLGYEIERLRERHASLVQENKALKLDLGQLRSLRRVEAIARRDLGMVTPRPGQIVVVPESPVQ